MTDLDDRLQEIRTEGERMESTLSEHPTASAVRDLAGEAIRLASEAVAQRDAEGKPGAMVSRILVELHVLLIGLAIGVGIVQIMDVDFSLASLIRFTILFIIGIHWLYAALIIAGDEAGTYSKTPEGKLVGFYLDVIMLAPIVALSFAVTNESVFYLSLVLLFALDVIANGMYLVRLRGKVEYRNFWRLSRTWAIDSTVVLGTTLTVMWHSHFWRNGWSELTGAMAIWFVIGFAQFKHYRYNRDIYYGLPPSESSRREDEQRNKGTSSSATSPRV